MCQLIIYDSSGNAEIEDSSKSDKDGGVGSGNWWAKRTDPALDLVSDSYSELDIVFSIRVSSTLLVYLILSTNYLIY